MFLVDDLEAISLRVHQISAAAGAIAEAQKEPLSHALHLIEECLWEVERKVDAVREKALAMAAAETLVPTVLEAARRPGGVRKRARERKA